MAAAKFAIDEIVTPFHAAMRDGQAEIDRLRERLVGLRAERAAVELLPADRAEIERRVDRRIAQGQAAKPFRFTGLFGAEEHFHVTLGRDVESVAVSVFDVVAALVPDALRAAMLADAPTNGIPADQKTARLAELDEQIEEVAVEEERLLRTIESVTGAHLPRRRDADPRILLAPDAELAP